MVCSICGGYMYAIDENEDGLITYECDDCLHQICDDGSFDID